MKFISKLVDNLGTYAHNYMSVKTNYDNLKIPIQFEDEVLNIAQSRASAGGESLSEYINRLVSLDISCQQITTIKKSGHAAVAGNPGQGADSGPVDAK